jgi:hypothetical protein
LEGCLKNGNILPNRAAADADTGENLAFIGD